MSVSSPAHFPTNIGQVYGKIAMQALEDGKAKPIAAAPKGFETASNWDCTPQHEMGVGDRVYQIGMKLYLKTTATTAHPIERWYAVGDAPLFASNVGANTLLGATPQKSATAPTQKNLSAALGAYEFHKMLKWSGTVQPGAAFGKSVTLSKQNGPDGTTIVANVLKNQPNMVVFERSGGVAGISLFSQPVRFDVLPK